MKKKLTTGVILAFAIMLTTFGALAATIDWNVLDFLFANREHPAGELMQVVDQSATDGQVTLTINSALCDGETFAMDWTVVNSRPESPVYLKVQEFTANGERLWLDGSDDFNDCWLPGAYGNGGSMQGGQVSEMPDALRTADTLDVVMTVGAYYPANPVYQMETYDPEAAKEKIAEGYLVIPEGDGLAMLDDEEEAGVGWFVGLGDLDLMENFTCEELRIAFTLDLAAGRASVKQLTTRGRYETGLFNAQIFKATVSPVGMILDVFIDSTDVAWRFKLTDENGQLLDVPWPAGEMYGVENADGSVSTRLKMAYYGLTEEALPDVISLTYFPEEDDPILLPMTVR